MIYMHKQRKRQQQHYPFQVDLTSLFSGVLQRQLEPDTRIFVYKPEVVGRVLKLINGLDHE